MLVEHRKLLKHVDAHQAAVKKMSLDEMDHAGQQQEASRMRIVGLENARRAIVQQIVREHRISGEVTIARLAKVFPDRGPGLLKLRDELKKMISQIQARTHIAGKVAGAILGHLNTVVRLIAGAVERAGIYTKSGVPQVSGRIGVMEAVG